MKKRYLLLIIVLLFPVFVFASTNTKSREGVDNYGVTKVKVTDDMKSYVLATPYVDASEMIYDFSDIFTEEEEVLILEKVKDFKERTGFDLVILTNDVSYSNDSKNDDYAMDFYDFNDFSKDGIIFFRNTNANPYYSVISSGQAQLYYYDDRMEELLDGIYDYVHSARYVDGVDKLISYLDTYYKQGKLRNYYIDEKGFLKKKKDYFVPILPALGISGIITAIVMSIMVNKNKMIRVATKATEYVDRKSIKYQQNEDKFISTSTSRTRISSSSSGGGGGHSSFGGHSGMGHSGGGRHG